MRSRVATIVAAGVVVVLTAAGCGDTTGGDPVAGSRPATTTAAEPTSDEPETTEPDPTTEEPTEEPTDDPSDDPGGFIIFGPTGWDVIEVGMDPEPAIATNMFSDTPGFENESCATWSAVNASPLESVVVSPRLGVAAIIPRSDSPIRTPEGIGFGSSAADVAAAYPDFSVGDVDTPNGARVAAIGNPAAVYRMSFTDAGEVSYLTLELIDQDCYG